MAEWQEYLQRGANAVQSWFDSPDDADGRQLSQDPRNWWSDNPESTPRDSTDARTGGAPAPGMAVSPAMIAGGVAAAAILAYVVTR